MFIVIKSGVKPDPRGPFADMRAAANHIVAQELLGYSILPLSPADMTPQSLVDAFIRQLAVQSPEGFIGGKPQLKWIETIKRVRAEFSLGLKEAKDAVEKYKESNDDIVWINLGERPGSAGI